MKVIIRGRRSTSSIRASWEDTKTELVEKSAADIVVELLVAAERQFREHAQNHYEWMVERKAQLIEEARRKKEEAERRERERLARLERGRLGALWSMQPPCAVHRISAPTSGK
jgi:hypothetical protein